MADLRHLLAIYVHAHQTGNSVPPHIDTEARATLAAEPPAPAEPDTDAVLALAAIIRQVDGSHSLGAAALAEAILSHPGVAFSVLPPASGPTTDDIWELCEDHEFHLGDGFDSEASAEIMLQIIRVALTRWGRPAPAQADHVPDAGNMVAADGEAEELATLLAIGSSCAAGAKLSPEQCRRAAALLREARPQPVPAADRPWKRPGWCDAEGRCWWFNRVGIPQWQLADGGPYGDFCLPHRAVPIPQPPQGGEVES